MFDDEIALAKANAHRPENSHEILFLNCAFSLLYHRPLTALSTGLWVGPTGEEFFGKHSDVVE